MPKKTTLSDVLVADQQEKESQRNNRKLRLYQLVMLGLIATALYHYLQFQDCFQVQVDDSAVYKKGIHNHVDSPPVHILFGLSGNDDGFFSEFEVALKSVLLNGPHHAPLEIHVMADEKAHNKLKNEVWPKLFSQNQRFVNVTTDVTTYQDPYSLEKKTSTRVTTVTSQQWFTNVTITTYNVEKYLKQWKKKIEKATKADLVVHTHTVGAYFRLLGHEILPPDVKRVFYIDTDVVVLANLAQVFEETPKDDDWYFQWSDGCSGEMFINIPQLPRFWDHVSQVNFKGKPPMHDQDVILGVQEKLDPNATLIRALPKPWDLLITRDWRELTPKQLLKYRPQVGAIHYNGGGASKEAYFDNGPYVNDQNAQGVGGWGLAARFYRDLPWSWAFYMGQSLAAGMEAGAKASTRIRITEYSTTVEDSIAE